MPKAFFDYLVFERNLSKNTYTAYKTDITQFVEFCELKNNNLLSVKTKDIRQWIISLLQENLNHSTIHRKLSSLKAFYNFACREGQIKDNPASYVILPKKQQRLPQFLKEQESEMFFDNQFFEQDYEGLRDQNIIQLFYLTGIRRQELIDLCTGDLDTDRNVISVLGKRNKTRYVPIPVWLVDQLSYYIKERNKIYGKEKPNLFLTSKGAPVYPKLIYRIVQKYITNVATLSKRSPHVLRHTFATQMLNAGADLNAIKELLGHANLAATEVYTHNSFQKLQKTYKQAHPRA